MDVAALLAEAAAEVGAPTEQEKSASTNFDRDDADTNRHGDRDGGNKDSKPFSLGDALKEAAEQVDLEESQEVKKALELSVQEVATDVLKIDSPRPEPTSGADAILLNAAEEVQDFYEDVGAVEPVEVIHLQREEEKDQEEESESDKDYYSSSEEEGGLPGGESDDDGDTDERDPDAADFDPKLNYPLKIACWKDRPEEVRSLLKKGAHPCARDGHGWTPLHWAASKGYEEVAEVLLRFCERSLTTDEAAGRKKTKVYVNAADKITGWTPLHLACIGGHPYMVEFLLKHRARRSKMNFLKERPVECIGRCKQSAFIRQLVEKKKKQKKMKMKNKKKEKSDQIKTNNGEKRETMNQQPLREDGNVNEKNAERRSEQEQEQEQHRQQRNKPHAPAVRDGARRPIPQQKQQQQQQQQHQQQQQQASRGEREKEEEEEEEYGNDDDDFD